MATDSSQAEKAYLARTGSGAWERAKPFSHAGADTLAESAHLLHDFAAAMMILQPAPNDLILDLGAGGCWCSDLIHQLGRHSIALDISVDMLRVGRSRPAGARIRAVAGDLQALPFRSGTFRKAICLSALHHVPDMRAAIREVARVLTDDGVALFSEPGRGHAKAAGSQAAMRDFGVLEQDLLIEEFADAAREAGFRDTRVKILSNATPSVDVTPEEFQALGRYVSTKRPLRAIRTIGRGIAEFFGLGKRSFLFGETFGISVLRVIRHASEDHPVIVASKMPLEDSRRGVIHRARIHVEAAAGAQPGGGIPVRARLTNAGSLPWPATSTAGVGHVRLGVQLMDADGRLLSRDFHRVDLPHDVAPGASVDVHFRCPAPETQGTYTLKFDLVSEGVTWFEAVGSPVATHTLIVG
jgi:ubiquinone/menaquinone biosynthesis C-methylase UbiE